MKAFCLPVISILLSLVSGLNANASPIKDLRAQLIYEFATQYRYINRISFLSCRGSTFDFDSYKGRNQTSPSNAPTNAFIDNFTLVESLLQASGILIKVLAIDTVSAYLSTISNRTQLWKTFLKSEDLRQAVVLILPCGNNSLKILELASKEGFFNSSYHWLLIDEGEEKSEGMNVKTKMKGDWKDYSANRSTKVGNCEPVNGCECKDTLRETLIKFVSMLNINMNTNLLVARRNLKINEADNDYTLFDLWSPGRRYGGKLNISKVGIFTRNNGLQMHDWYRKTPSIVRRMDMKNALIRCMIVITNRMTESIANYLNHQQNPHLDSMNRYHFALLSHVRDIFNFRFLISRTKSWGYLKNGKVDGMIGALVRREVDIGGSPIFFRKERADLIDYTARTWVARPCFIFRHPNSTHATRNAFLKPFSNKVWICIGFCGVIITLILWNQREIEKKLLNEKRGGAYKLAIKKRQHPRTMNSRNSTLETFRNASKNQPNDTKDNHQHFLAGVLSRFRRFVIFGSKQTPPFSPEIFQKTTSQATHAYIKSMSAWHVKKFNRTISSDRKEIFGENPDEDTNSWPRNIDEKLERTNYTDFRFNDLERNSQSSILFFVGAICQQGIHYSCHLLSGRVVILSTLLFAFCISQFYSGTIVGTLLMEKPKTMKTIRDLIDSSLNIAIENIGYNRDYFRRTTEPDAIELYRKKISQPVDEWGGSNTRRNGWWPGINKDNINRSDSEAESNRKHDFTTVSGDVNQKRGKIRKDIVASKESWLGPEKGLKLMKTGGYAFHVDVATAYKIITETFTEQEICELTEIQLFPPQKMVGIVQKGSPLRKMITYGLRRIAETGLMDRQRKVWHSQKPRCIRQIQQTDLGVGMEIFSSALFVLIFGLAASGMILALEVMYDLWHKRSTASKSPNIGQEWSRRTTTSQREQHRITRPAVSFRDNANGDYYYEDDYDEDDYNDAASGDGEKNFEFVN